MNTRILAAAALGLGLAVTGAAGAQQKSLTLGTASVGGTYFVYGGVVASLLSQKIGANVSTQQTQGPNQSVILVDDKQVGLGMASMGVALQGWSDTSEWTKRKKYSNSRAVFPM